MADAIEILDNPTPMPAPSTIDMNLVDAMVLLANNGTLEATIGVAKADIDSKSAPTIARKPIIDNGDDPSIAHAPRKARKAKPKAAKTAVKSAPKTALNWAGTPMKADKGTASSGQVKWLIANAGMLPADAKNMSMVKASNLRARLTGKTA
jgi:hypothetical protein